MDGRVRWGWLSCILCDLFQNDSEDFGAIWALRVPLIPSLLHSAVMGTLNLCNIPLILVERMHTHIHTLLCLWVFPLEYISYISFCIFTDSFISVIVFWVWFIVDAYSTLFRQRFVKTEWGDLQEIINPTSLWCSVKPNYHLDFRDIK